MTDEREKSDADLGQARRDRFVVSWDQECSTVAPRLPMLPARPRDRAGRVDDPAVRRLITITGVNLMVATGIVAAIGDIRRFNGPQKLERARILLAYREDPSFFAVGQALGLNHPTVQRCVERAVAEGTLAALDDYPRQGRAPSITIEAKAMAD